MEADNRGRVRGSGAKAGGGGERGARGGDAGAITEAEIEAAIAKRQQAKADKDYAGADQVREDLLAQGIVLEDSREGTTWRRS